MIAEVTVRYQWRGGFTNDEINELHAAAFHTRVYSPDEWNWVDLTAAHSLGWVLARQHDVVVGFVNVVWDGLVHAWIQDTMVDPRARHRGISRRLVAEATDHAARAGCEWLHVDFDPDLSSFYFDACGFTPTTAGLIPLSGITGPPEPSSS